LNMLATLCPVPKFASVVGKNSALGNSQMHVMTEAHTLGLAVVEVLRTQFRENIRRILGAKPSERSSGYLLHDSKRAE
jgi:hypothetical protein